MLEMKNVTKTFGNFKALDDLTLTVPSGRVYGLVGPNGAGKSTAIRHLTGIYRPDSGAVTMDGQPIYENPAVKAAIGYIPDEIFYYPSATLEDVCDYVGIMNRGKMLLEKSLADMQGSTVKLQLVGDAPKELDILNASVSGRLKTLIVRGEAEEVGAKMAACKPAYFDVLPLSLEEIFIYELGGVDYEIKDILL